MQTEQIWSDYHDQLLNFIRRRVGGNAAAEDLLQDVFVKIHSRLDTLLDANRVQSWLYSIARNTIIDYHRLAKDTAPLPASLQLTLEPDDSAVHELAPCVRCMIGILPERYRQPLLMSEIEELPLKEVAARLGLSVPGAKSRVQRGRAMLRKMFLDCCKFEFDGRGKPIAWSPKTCCVTAC